MEHFPDDIHSSKDTATYTLNRTKSILFDIFLLFPAIQVIFDQLFSYIFSFMFTSL